MASTYILGNRCPLWRVKAPRPVRSAYLGFPVLNSTRSLVGGKEGGVSERAKGQLVLIYSKFSLKCIYLDIYEYSIEVNACKSRKLDAA